MVQALQGSLLHKSTSVSSGLSFSALSCRAPNSSAINSTLRSFKAVEQKLHRILKTPTVPPGHQGGVGQGNTTVYHVQYAVYCSSVVQYEQKVQGGGVSTSQEESHNGLQGHVGAPGPATKILHKLALHNPVLLTVLKCIELFLF